MQKIHHLVLSVTALALAGCGAGHLEVNNPDAAITASSLQRPSHIYVAPVDTTQGQWKYDADELDEAKTQVKNDLEKDLCETLSDIAPTTLGNGNGDGWLIVVTPIKVDPGSLAMRTFVGGGAGQSKVNATFSVYDLAKSNTVPILNGGDNADSGLEGGFHTFPEGNGRNSKRIARDIRNYLKDRLEASHT